MPRFSRSQKALLGILSVGMLCLFFYIAHGERDDKREFSIGKSNSYIEGLRVVNKKNGTDLWVIKARKADLTRDETIARLESVTMDIKKEGVILNADNGVYNMNTKDLRLENNIKILTKDSVISAKELSWNSSVGMLSSPDKIQLEGGKYAIEGEGLTAGDSRVKLLRNVKATFY